ncbi:diguanylate cyclase [Achromobacter xylosoxidans]|jgi:diguanylate cyclase|uniref:Diguanylate cyclase DosC n=1 Tax=Alcaligenes xylosoxydans xylosoxydans TaxID=85698 RepID=A0A9W5EU96_ALCXX|nr:diguanylate cyclase [Achromobacter xylosoxidans]AUZ19788.1 diguanylate cyclase [Achromobacter xylosoxidans]KWU18186.1 diguanylate kinase [Achromobacter xylosoxidans]MCH4575301.1 diguanylate cyclase [Achromobacter xylosoxidans]MCZ8399892.1 diguanylate cyclase [Achromobacter xylosoxidans]MDD7988446.1 diguanylate cyclase [Achromobacter xylosoxidans]
MSSSSRAVPSSPDPAGQACYLSASNAQAWQAVYSSVDAYTRGQVAAVVSDSANELVDAFYSTLLADAEAGPRLSHEIVSTRLHKGMKGWLKGLLCVREQGDIAALMATQKKVGEVHARVHIPIHLVMAGARILKNEIAQRLRASDLDGMAASIATQYVCNLFDLAIEQMSRAFMRDINRGARNDEAYRLFALGQNISTERERQRAALLEWSQAVLIGLHYRAPEQVLPRLAASEFGLWLQHKGGVLFESAPALGQIIEAVARLDDVVLPRLLQGGPESLPDQVRELQELVARIKHLLNGLFDMVAEIESGSDPLTNVLNRRFLPSVIGREILIATREHSTFSVLLLDIDHFKAINDSHGHAGGDQVLRQFAEVVHQSCRSSDFVFRYGGEEFLVVLVDTAREAALAAAEKLGAEIRRHAFAIPEAGSLRITASIGVATFDGHPDYAYLIDRADKALYQAKQAGRDRSVAG